MPVCLFCQAEVLYVNLPCSRCGKRQAEHPSMRPSTYNSAQPGEKPPSEPLAAEERAKVPSLMPLAPKRGSGLHAAAPSAKAPANRPMAAPAVSPGVGGAMFDEDDVFSGGGGGGTPLYLELDIAAAPPTAHLAPAESLSAGPAPQSPHSRPGGGPPSPLASTGPRAPRAPAVDAPSQLTPEEAEVRDFAAFGPPPTSWWQAPLYAYRVKTRQAELRRRLVERQAEARAAQEAAEDVLVAFGERARPGAVKEHVYGTALAAIQASEDVMRSKDTALGAELDAHKAQLAAVDERIAGREAELAGARTEERRVEEELAQVEATRQRAEAKAKRAEIELRNVASRLEPKRTMGSG